MLLTLYKYRELLHWIY